MAFVLAAALAAALLAACGDEDAQTITFTLRSDGNESKFTAPTSADPGLTEITLDNEGEKESDLQLIRVEGDHSAEEVIASLEKAMDGKAFPVWFFAGGGIGPTPPGESRTVTQVLEPGSYYAFDTEGSGPPDAKTVTLVEVSGDASDEEVDADATVSAFEYGFSTDGLTSGETEVAFANAGLQPHHLLYAPLNGDATAVDVERFFKSEKGKPPFNEKETKNTAVIEGGESQLVTLDLEPGRYVLICFISNREGGPPHALKGMVDAVEVE